MSLILLDIDKDNIEIFEAAARAILEDYKIEIGLVEHFADKTRYKVTVENDSTLFHLGVKYSYFMTTPEEIR